MGENDTKDLATLQLMRGVISAEHPDFIVFAGDQVSGYAVFHEENRKLLWQQALSVAVEFGIPFATIFGNHDDQPYHLDPLLWNRQAALTMIALVLCAFAMVIFKFRKSAWSFLLPTFFFCILIFYVTIPNPYIRESLLDHERFTYQRLSNTGHSPLHVHGVSNYRLVLQGPITSVALYFLDTGGGWLPEAVHSDQVKWLQGYDPIPSLVFMHISPVHSIFSRSRGCVGPAPLESPSQCPGSDALLQILPEMGTIGVFFGHDHGNSWCCPDQGVLFCYGKHSGYGGYDFSGSERGARVIDILMSNKSNVRIETRISQWKVTKHNSEVIKVY